MGKKIIVVGIIFLAIIVVAFVYFILDKKTFNPTKIFDREQAFEGDSAGCLKDNEVASYENDKSDFVGKINVIVKNKQNNEAILSFWIGDVMLRNYHHAELHKCGVYVLKSFNDDYRLSKTLPGFSKELWFYNYKSEGKKIINLAGENQSGKPEVYYSYDFRISPNEKYLVLEKSYLSKDDYALVIKDINTKEDLLVFNLKDILAKHHDIIPGSFGLGSWTKDGKYLYGDLFQGALSTVYYRVEAGTWKVDVYSAPPDILAGVERAINYENWHLAYVDIPTFTGIQEVYEQIIEQAKKEGKQKNLFIYNIQTKEKIKIASADPEWRFNINWLSESELEYELPTGEKKIYKVEEK